MYVALLKALSAEEEIDQARPAKTMYVYVINLRDITIATQYLTLRVRRFEKTQKMFQFKSPGLNYNLELIVDILLFK